MSIFTKIFGTKKDRDVKALLPIVDKVNSLEDKAKSLDNGDFPKETKLLKQRVAGGESLDSLLPWAFAIDRKSVV